MAMRAIPSRRYKEQNTKDSWMASDGPSAYTASPGTKSPKPIVLRLEKQAHEQKYIKINILRGLGNKSVVNCSRPNETEIRCI